MKDKIITLLGIITCIITISCGFYLTTDNYNKNFKANYYYDSRGMAYTNKAEFIKDSIKQAKLDSIEWIHEKQLEECRIKEQSYNWIKEYRRDSIIETQRKTKAYLEYLNNKQPNSYNINIKPSVIADINGNPTNYNCTITLNY